MFCSYCGQKLEEDALYCPKCGAKVGDDVKAPDPSAGGGKEHKRKNFFLAAGIVIGIIIIGTAVFLFLNNGKDNGAEKPDKQGIEKEEKVNESEYIFPHSDKEYLTDADVEKLTEEELGFARNEIIARHGRIFTDEKYKPYFEEKSWYKGTVEPEEFDADYENQLNEIEKANVEIIKRYEEQFQVNEQIKYYTDILEEYQKGEKEGYVGNESQYPHVNPILYGYKSEQSLHYALLDLSEDGTPELIIGYPASGEVEYTIIDMYGYADGKVEKFMNGIGLYPEPINNYIGEHERYYICDNLMIKKEETNGVSEDSTTFYRMEENSTVLLLAEHVVKSMDSYYRSDDGLSTSEITEEEYENTRNKYAVKMDISWDKLEDLRLRY